MRSRRSSAGQQHGARLFVAYAVASLIPVLVLGLVLVHSAQQSGESRALSRGRAQAAVIMQMAIAPSLDDRTLSSRLSDAETDRLRRASDLAVYTGSLTALRLLTFGGRVVFSDDGSMTHSLPSADPAFRTAKRGGTSAAIVDVPGRGDTMAIRVLQPVVPSTTGQATGVLELYLPYAPIAAAIKRDVQGTYLTLGVGLGVLYLVLAAISWSTTRRLRRNVVRQTYQARHDPLTELPNRSAFREFAGTAIADRDRGGALVLVDLDRFKEVNDTLGHHAGDDLLRRVAGRLTDALRTDDHVARLGGDEFGLVLPGATDHDEVLKLLDSVHDELSKDVEIDGTVLTIEASFGVALFPEHGTDLDQLLVDADAAMYQSKRGVRPTVVFEPGAVAPRLRSHEVHAELHRALESDELVLHYQPKISLDTGEIVGVEALARWNHPTRGLLAPLEFVPVVEASSLIGPFTKWAVRQALSDRTKWRAQGAKWPVAVNVSAHNLESEDFVDVVVDLLDECDAEPGDLIIELTETALASDSRTLNQNIAALSAIGVAVSVDDFGTGSTALVQLRSTSVKEIKIDRAFVSELAANAHDQNVARALVQLAHGMNCTVVAEGVEDEAAAGFLRSVGCDQAQGYLYARPRPWQELLDGAAAPAADVPVVATGVPDPAGAPSRPLELMP